jgi:hypothetical protein
MDNARDRIVGRRMGEADEQRAMRVDAAGTDAIADAFRDRYGLPGDRSLVNVGLPLDHLTIRGHAIAGPNQNDIADLQALDGDLANLSSFRKLGGARYEIDQGLDTRFGATRGDRLKQLTDREEDDNH